MTHRVMMYKSCKCGEKLRQDVMQDDKIFLSDIAPERGMSDKSVQILKGGVHISSALIN